MADEPASKRRRFTAKIVTIRVGEDPVEEFFIHEDTLKSHSDFFKAALDKKWKEGQSLVINLPDDKAEVFSQYANWLYVKKLDLDAKLPVPDTAGQEAYGEQSADLDEVLAELYIFGEKILDARFCNAVMHGLVDNFTAFASYEDKNLTKEPRAAVLSIDICNELYEGTSSTSPVRRFLVDTWISECYDGMNLDATDDFHPEFARDLLKVILQEGQAGWRRKISASRKAKWFKSE